MRRYADKRDENEKQLIKYLERVGCKVQQLSQRGIPDLLVGVGSCNILVEVKMPGGKLTEDQERFISKWENVYVVQSIKEIKKVLRLYMPTRIYMCEKCGTFENKESIKTNPLTKCPKCDTIVKQIYSAPTIVFRGNGWGGKNDVQS